MSGITVELINGADLKPIYGDIKTFSSLRVIPILSAPYFLYHLAMSIKNLVDGIINSMPHKIADSILDVIGNAAEITRIVSVFVGNTVFSVVASFFSAMRIVIHGKQLCHSIKFQRELKMLDSLDDKTDYQLERRLNINAAIVREAEMADVRKRSIQQTLSHTLQITAAAISLVATAVLLVFPPLAPVVFGLWALSGVILLTDFIADKVIAHRFEKVYRETHQPKILA